MHVVAVHADGVLGLKFPDDELSRITAGIAGAE
jgi:hypothetical protein